AILHGPAESVDGGSRTAAWPLPTRAAARAVAGPRSCVSDSDTSHDTVPSAHRPVAGSALPLSASPAPPLAAPAGSPLFCDHRLQCPNVHCLFGHDVLQLPVLLLQLPQSSCLAQFQPAELALPAIKTCPRDPVPPIQFPRLDSAFRLLQDGDNL